MNLRSVSTLVFCGLALALSAAPALADSPTPTANPRPSPTGSPASSSPRASPAPSGPATASPSPSPSASSLDPSTAAALQAAQDAMQATSVLERIQAMRRYLAIELDALTARQRALDDERARTAQQIASTEASIAAEEQRLDDLVRAEYRQARRTPLEEILAHGSIVDGLVRVAQLSELQDEERAVVTRLLSLRSDLAVERAQLDRDASAVADTSDGVRAKRNAMTTLESRAQLLVAAQGKGDAARTRAEVEVVAALADEQARASEELLAIVAKLVGSGISGQLSWTWPSGGMVSQIFGPTSFGLEPPLLYRGVTYPHFHAAIDIAAPLFTPVVAAAPGRVSFVGHFSDGAMVVLISHADGFVTLYAHLDDGLRPSQVHVGDTVDAGQVIGAVGLTGVTTGAHLHFEVLQGTVPVDPLTVLPPR